MCSLLADNKILRFNVLGSTNDYAKQHHAVLSSGTVILADTQRCGRGRFNRKWHSGKGGLWFSIVIRHKYPSRSFLLTFAAAAAVAYSIRGFGLDASVKWPNDVYIRGKKVCGILTENIISGSKAVSIVGVGINVNNSVRLASATTMKSELRKRVDKDALLAAVLARFRAYSADFNKGITACIMRDWKSCWSQGGKTVALLTLGGKVCGRVCGVSSSGALLIKSSKGHVVQVIEGDLARHR